MTAATEIKAEYAVQIAQVNQTAEVDLTEAKYEVAEQEEEEEVHSGQACSYVLYIGNLNPKHSSDVLCRMLKDIFGMVNVTLQRHNIEVIRKRRQAHAFVQLATEISLEHILRCLLIASNGEKDLTKELVKKGKTLVVGPGKKSAFGNKDGREVRLLE